MDFYTASSIDKRRLSTDPHATQPFCQIMNAPSIDKHVMLFGTSQFSGCSNKNAFEIKWRYDPRTCWTIYAIVSWTWKLQVTQRDSNPWPLRCRCSALTNWATKSHGWEPVNLLGSCFPVKEMSYERNVIYEVRCFWNQMKKGSSHLLDNLSNIRFTQ